MVNIEKERNERRKEAKVKFLKKISQSIHDCWIHIKPSIPTHTYSTKSNVCVCVCVWIYVHWCIDTSFKEAHIFLGTHIREWKKYTKKQNGENEEKKVKKINEHSFGWNEMQCIAMKYSEQAWLR